MPKTKKRKNEEMVKVDDSTSYSGPEGLEPCKKATKSSNDGDLMVIKTGKTKKMPCFVLSKDKIVSVSTLNDRTWVIIQEYPKDISGSRVPSKDGLKLDPVEWEQLKGIMADVDEAIVERI